MELDMIWKDIPNFENTHEINNFGVIRKKDTKKELTKNYSKSLWCSKQRKHVCVVTNTLLGQLFSPSEHVKLKSNPSTQKKSEELYMGEIKGEIWREFYEDKVKSYWISNHGRVIKDYSLKNTKFRREIMLKPSRYTNHWIYTINDKSISVRKLLFEKFKPEEINYDIGIPPKKALISRIKSGKIGVYRYAGIGKKKWRYLIQKDNKQYAGYFHTKLQARINWILKYSELNNLKLEMSEVMELI